jgi:hypothetical protein
MFTDPLSRCNATRQVMIAFREFEMDSPGWAIVRTSGSVELLGCSALEIFHIALTRHDTHSTGSAIAVA